VWFVKNRRDAPGTYREGIRKLIYGIPVAEPEVKSEAERAVAPTEDELRVLRNLNRFAAPTTALRPEVGAPAAIDPHKAKGVITLSTDGHDTGVAAQRRRHALPPVVSSDAQRKFATSLAAGVFVLPGGGGGAAMSTANPASMPNGVQVAETQRELDMRVMSPSGAAIAAHVPEGSNVLYLSVVGPHVVKKSLSLIRGALQLEDADGRPSKRQAGIVVKLSPQRFDDVQQAEADVVRLNSPFVVGYKIQNSDGKMRDEGIRVTLEGGIPVEMKFLTGPELVTESAAFVGPRVADHQLIGLEMMGPVFGLGKCET
jgi:hypothetical protein